MVKEAKEFAYKAHQGQCRKGTATPYIVHPKEVAAIVATLTDDNNVIAAAWLHDTVEDCPNVTIETIKYHFGSEVAAIVASETENKSLGWLERKTHTINQLKDAPLSVQIVALGDKLSNIRDIDRDYPVHGENLWLRFRMKEKQIIAWYYKGVRDSLKPSLGYTPAFLEYHELVEKVFATKK